MKKIIFFLLTASFSTALTAQDEVAIEPSGHIILRDISVKPFDVIEASGLYELVLTEGDKEGVKVEADDNLQNMFSISNKGDKLVIEMPNLKDHKINSRNKRNSLHWKVYVVYNRLKRLDVSLVGNVTSSTPVKSDALEINSKAVGNINLQIVTNNLTLTNKGVGNVTLKGTAKDAIVENAGVGQFDGEELIVQSMDINNSGVGGADVNVEKTLKIKQSFLGKVRNKGTAKTGKGEGVVI